jgi:heterogeneous nuclear ribonucleoprotein A1/A3
LSSGRYNTTGSSDGNTGGYNSSPNTYGAANYNTGSSSGGTSGEFGGDFSGRFGGNNFAGNVTGGGGYSGSSSTGEFYGGGASYGANKPQYNGQDDLMGDFFDKEVEGK